MISSESIETKPNWLFLLVIVVFSVACARSIDLSARSCPCVEGFVCDESRNICVLPGDLNDASITADGAQQDANPDTSIQDAAVPIPAVCSEGDAPMLDPKPFDATACDDGTRSLAFCRSVDDGGETHATWLSNAVGGSMQVETSQVYRGTNANKFSVSSSRDTVYGYPEINGPSDAFYSDGTTDIYARAYFYFPSGWNTATDLLMLRQGGGTGNNDIAIRTNTNNKIGYFSLTGTYGGSSSRDAYSDFAIPIEVWSCLEIHASSSDERVDVWMDDVCIGSWDTGGRVDMKYFSIQLGFINQLDQADSYPQTFYVDEIMVSDTRIGCD
ncbi:MAG: hypothetical protein IPJ88_03130 [Myxococcales bacterium]|nr:MAG: hypothetical protein IPJ88_03130 [Myxococcales bacterium]